MTGAGFGGCTINVVNKDDLERFIEKVGEKYGSTTELKADFYVVEVGAGAREIFAE